MRYVNFVSGLRVEEVPHVGKQDMEYFSLSNPVLLDDGTALGASFSTAYERRIVPIIQMCGLGAENVFVAYSDEVEELLGIPIRTLVAERDNFKRNANQYRLRYNHEYAMSRLSYGKLLRINAWGFWRRLKFAFNGELAL